MSSRTPRELFSAGGGSTVGFMVGCCIGIRRIRWLRLQRLGVLTRRQLLGRTQRVRLIGRRAPGSPAVGRGDVIEAAGGVRGVLLVNVQRDAPAAGLVDAEGVVLPRAVRLG